MKRMSDGDVVKYDWGKVWLDRTNHLSRVDFVPGTHQRLRQAEEQISALQQLLGEQRWPYLVDLRNVKATDQDARKYFGSTESKARWTAAALLTGSPLSNAIGNVFLAAYNSRQNPVKLFSNEAEAIAWLKQFS
jgi:hypothetical protein